MLGDFFMERIKKQETICWDCKRSCGKNKCQWANNFTTIKGWDAEQNDLGFLVKSCPEYIEDDRVEITNSVEEITKILGITQRTFYRWINSKPAPIKYINKNYFSKMNYRLIREKENGAAGIQLYRYTLIKINK